MDKKCKVVMLPTNNKAILYLDSIGIYSKNRVDNSILGHNLYILSDDEIKEGDWYLDTLNNLVFPYNKIHKQLPTDKKIIALTDSSLMSVTGQMIHGSYHPSIPQSFIGYYISEYNKSNKIEEVMVEYENIFHGYFDQGGEDWRLKLKLNSNTININITPIKDNWTRDKMIELCQSAFYSGRSMGLRIAHDPDYYMYKSDSSFFEDWLKNSKL